MPKDAKTPDSGSGQTPEDGAEPSPQPSPEAVDERGVPWRNVAAENRRKFEQAQRERDEARGSLIETNKRFDDYMAAVRMGIAPAPVSPPQNIAGQDHRVFQGGVGQNNPVVAPTNRAPVAPQNPQGQPLDQSVIDQLVDQRFMLNQATTQYQNAQAQAESTVRERYPAAVDPGSDFSKELEYRFHMRKQEAERLGMLPSATLKLDIANEMVMSGTIDPGTKEFTSGNRPVGNGEPPAPTPPEPQPQGDEGPPPEFVKSFTDTGMTEADAKAAWDRVQNDPNSASHKYAHGLRMNWGRR
jgi:hypothetical protein